MVLTKLWTVLLALLATLALAGTLLLFRAGAHGELQADRQNLQTVTDAGLAALEAEVRASSVVRAPLLLIDPRLVEAMDAYQTAQGRGAVKVNAAKKALDKVLSEVAEDHLLRDNPQMTVALVDRKDKVVAGTGLAEEHLSTILASADYSAVGDRSEGLFSRVLGKRLNVIAVSRTTSLGQRLVAMQPINMDAGSMLRRVIGTDHPAAIVRSGTIVGDMLGSQPVEEALRSFASNHAQDAPNEGAGPVHTVGQGLDTRLGSLGRVPGPAGRGDAPAYLVVLSGHTAAAGEADLAGAIRSAVSDGLAKGLNWPILIGLLAVSLALAVYLPTLESALPLRRLTSEVHAIAEGHQVTVFPERHRGPARQLAQTLVAAFERTHADGTADGYESAGSGRHREVELSDSRPSPVAPSGPAGPSPAPGSHSRPLSIDLPDSPGQDVVVESHRHDDDGGPGPDASSLDSAPAPTLTDEVDDTAGFSLDDEPAASDSLSSSFAAPTGAPPPSPFGGDDDGDALSMPALEPEPEAAPTRAPTPAAPPPQAAAPPAPAPAAAAPASASARGGEKYRQLFDEFVETKRMCGESLAGFDYPKFERKIDKNRESLRARPGVADVSFSVYVKDGKAALKAKVVKG